MCPENEPLKCVLQANRIKLTMLVLFQFPVFAHFALKIITSAEDIVLRCKTESTCKVLVFAYLVCAEVRLIALKSKWWRVKMYRIPKTRFVRMK